MQKMKMEMVEIMECSARVDQRKTASGVMAISQDSKLAAEQMFQ
jgi:hypothetical protein